MIRWLKIDYDDLCIWMQPPTNITNMPTCIYNEKFRYQNFRAIINSPCPNPEGIKMRSCTSSEGSWLVRIVVQCTHMRVAIDMHSWANGTKCHVLREARSVLCHSLMIDSTFKQSIDRGIIILYEQSENVAITRWVHEQLLLARSEGCDL